ncbi:MAG: tRNA lysidine(34) synthetase TilS [Clostridia bacterium]|nr:tRNA lysidine(34) synthetase TilS [Clostridia bacterium]
MKQKILQTIKKNNLIENGDRLVIGVSGGPDSICLLHILNELKQELNFKIYVAHINHMIREEADLETEYVKEFCNKIEVDCFVKRIDVVKIATELKKGTEETGRQVRYEFFNEILEKTNSNKIATAHNNNDKAETIIMNILRGSGTTGLKGIEPIRDNKFIRPLIDITREEIEEYCINNNLNPKIDKSNNENIYTRNKIRNVVIPYIKQEFNQNIIKTINRLSEVITEENEYLNKITQETFNEINVGADLVPAQQNKNENKSITKPVGATSSRPHFEEIPQIKESTIILDLKQFNNLELVIKRRLILYTINELLGSTEGIEKINIDDIIKLCTNNIGNKYLMPTKNIKILVKKGKIFFIALN